MSGDMLTSKYKRIKPRYFLSQLCTLGLISRETWNQAQTVIDDRTWKAFAAKYKP